MPTTASNFALTSALVSGSVRRLNETGDAGTNTATQLTYDAGAETIRVNPLAVNAASSPPPAVGGAASGFGWRLINADLESFATAKRIITGDLVAVLRGLSSIPAGQSATLTAVVYRVSSGGVLTEVARGTGAAVTVSGVAANDFSAPVALGTLLLEAGETLQVEMYVASASGALNLAQTITISVGQLLSRVETTGVRTRYLRSASGVSSGLASVQRQVNRARSAVAGGAGVYARRLIGLRTGLAVAPAAGTAVKEVRTRRTASVGVIGSSSRTSFKTLVASVTPTGKLARRLDRTLAASSAAVGTASRRVIAVRAFLSSAGTATSLSRKLLLTKLATITPVAVLNRRIAAGRAFLASSASVGTAVKTIIVKRTASVGALGTFDRSVIAVRDFAAGAGAVASYARSVIVARQFAAAVSPNARGRVDMAFNVLNRIVGTGGGGTTVIVISGPGETGTPSGRPDAGTGAGGRSGVATAGRSGSSPATDTGEPAKGSSGR